MTISDFTRWLYRGQRPNWIARILNRASAAVASSGVASNYLVGDNVQWVHNVRASGGRAVLRSGAREEIQLEEVPVDQRAPLLRASLQRAPGARPHGP